MAVQTTSTLSNEVQVYYEAKFLERAKHSLVHEEGAQKRTQKANSGKTIRFTRYTPLSTVTTPLTEGSNPAEASITEANVDATLAEYGNVVKVSKLLSTVSIDREGAEKTELLGQNMGETLDELTRNELYSGATVQLAAGKSALSSIAASDTLSAAEVRKAVRTLKKNKAMRYPDGFFLAKISPDTSYDLMGDNVWVNSKTYSDVKALYAGEVGELHGARFLESTNPKTESSTVTVYSNFFHGANAFGCFDLEKDPPQLYVKIPGAQDTSNPTDRYSTIGWAGSYVSKTLVGEWIINVKTAASA
jgi:N4-gp56 family major capsid protein